MIRERLNAGYDALPSGVRHFISPLVEPGYELAKRALSLPAQRCQETYFLRGTETQSATLLTVLYSGDPQTMRYFCGRLYSREPLVRKMGRRPVWRLQRLGSAKTVQADLVLLELDSFWGASMRREGYLCLPQWVLFRMDISQPWSEFRTRFARKSLRSNLTRVRKSGYYYSLATDNQAWRHFYEHMYLPYARKRYGDSCIVYSPRQHHRVFERGGHLLFLHTRDHRRVAGVLLVPENRTLKFHSLGIRDDADPRLAAGSGTALYYFSILWAREQGYRCMDFGHCRPFLDDGLFLYKKRWGMRIDKSPRIKTLVGIRALSHRLALRNIARRMDCVFLHDGRLKALACIGHDQPVGEREMRERFRKRYIEGLDRLFLVAPGGFTPAAREAVAAETGGRLSLLAGEPAQILLNTGLRGNIK